MTAGQNSGGNLNILLFEVGMVTSDPVLGTSVGKVISVHPLVVVPSSIRYSDSSRSPVAQTGDGAVITRSGRALLSLSLSGVWGVESRGLGPYVGTGEVRAQRFWREAVRLPDAISRGDVDEAIDLLTGTPFLRLLLADYNPDRSTFYVNLYDFWHGISYECNIRAYTWDRQHRSGGASGLISYTMTIEEVGPCVVAGQGQRALRGLFGGLSTWDKQNEVIKSYTPDAIAASVFGVSEVIRLQMEEQLEAMRDTVGQIADLMGAAPAAASRSSLGQASGAAQGAGAGYFATASAARTSAGEAIVALRARSSGYPDAEAGTVDWSALIDEGFNAELETFAQRAALGDVEDAAAWQPVAGVLFGMSRGDFQAYATGGGAGGSRSPALQGSVLHVVRTADTPDALEAVYGVSWAQILAVNGLTPDEALMPGTELAIPRPRAAGPQPIDGLPTYGSHVGRAAWGVDLSVEFQVDGLGAPVLVSGGDVLEQGIELTIAEYADAILKTANTITDQVRARYVGQRIAALLLTDERVAGVQGVDVGVDAAGGFSVEVSVAAINGGTIRTGGPS